MTESIIRLSNLTKFYGKARGIENLNLEVFKGEIFGFLGPNGAGKTTTLRLMLNLLRPTSGNVKIFGKEILNKNSRVFQNIGNVPGEFNLYNGLTGNYFLKYMDGFSNKSPVQRDGLIESFKLTSDDLNKKIKYYSHGMKQKLVIIQAIQKDPDLLIMDEPTESLDPLNQNILYEYLKKSKDRGKTVFFSSHNLSEVEKICDRVGLVRNGRLVAVESLSSLKKKTVRRMEITFSEKNSLSKFLRKSFLQLALIEKMIK